MGLIYYKTDEEIEQIRESCSVVVKVLTLVGTLLRPGISGTELDRQSETLILDHGGKPGFKGFKDFPSTLCFSVNEQVVHGIPGEHQVIREGDIVSVDCGVLLNGFFGDAAYTFAVGEVEEETLRLLTVTNQSLYKGIEQAVIGKRVGDISFAIQNFVEKEQGFSIVRELVGHGVGRDLHEAPEVPNYGKRGSGVKIKEGLVIAIEPMVNQGTKEVRTLKDGWTVTTKDKKPSAHFEHSIAITKEGPKILSSHRTIEEAIEKNQNLTQISSRVVSAVVA